jgi:hypothetical protein
VWESPIGLRFKHEPEDSVVRSSMTASGEQGGRPRSGGQVRSAAKGADFAWLHEMRRQQEHEHEPSKQAAVIGPEVVLCDSGELDDIAHLVAQLGEPPLRVRPGDLRTLEPWEEPGRLFVTTARVAFQPLPSGMVRRGVARVAVAEAEAATVTTALLRRGFRYVVRRPVHRESLRLLLGQILFRGREQRRATRFPYGAEVAWRMGLRAGTCFLADISSVGCRALFAAPPRIGSRIRLSVPLERGGKRMVKLRGRLLRRDYGRRENIATPASTLIGFERMSAGALADLDLLLSACAAGPASTQDGLPALSHGAPLSDEGLPPKKFEITPWERAHDDVREEDDAVKPEYERRLSPRMQLDREVVTLDGERGRVVHSLFGRDLSLGGMSVDPHPLLTPGERLRIALYGSDTKEPLVLEARVVRSDGPRGLGMRFENMSAAMSERLRALLATLPTVEALGEDAKRGQGVVLGEILLKKIRPARLRSA